MRNFPTLKSVKNQVDCENCKKWEQRRYEVARSLQINYIAKIFESGKAIKGNFLEIERRCAETAVRNADFLIAELKKQSKADNNESQD